MSCSCNCSTDSGDIPGGGWDPSGINRRAPQIAFVSEYIDDYYQRGTSAIYVMDADGSDQSMIATVSGINPYQPPIWSPDDSKIACETVLNTIYLIDAESLGQTDIRDDAIYGNSPSWSPDSTKIAFTSQYYNDNGNDDIYVINADGTGLTNLTNDLGRDRNPVWSPDGQKIAFMRSDNLYVMNSDGTEQTQISYATRVEVESMTRPFISWSPDSSKIVFEINGSIAITNSDGSDPTLLTKDPSTRWTNTYPVWSPDGEKIVFVSARTGNREIYVMNTDGTNETNLTNHPAHDIKPIWSRDSNRIVFESNRDGVTAIYTINCDGTNLIKIAAGSNPSCSP